MLLYVRVRILICLEIILLQGKQPEIHLLGLDLTDLFPDHKIRSISGVTPANTGYYVLTVQNSFGCSKIDSIDVQLFDNPALNILSQTNVLCNGDLTGATQLK
jgi:hypothetical protein